MRTFIVTLPESDFLLFKRPGLDLVSGQIVELDSEHSHQLDLFAPLPSGQRWPIGKILHNYGKRFEAAFRQSGDTADRERGRAYHMVAATVDELPSGHDLFDKLNNARAFPEWTAIERDFVEGLGGGLDLSLVNYPSLVFVSQLESLLDAFLERVQ